MKRPARARHTTTGVAPAYSLKATAVVRVGSNAPAAVENRLHGLCGGAYEDLVERHALRPADGEGDDVGDVLGGDADLGGRFLGRLLAVGVGDVVGELGRDGAGFDHGHADVGLELDA